MLVTASTVERIQCIETFLLARLNKLEVIDRIVKSSVEILLDQAGQVKVEEMAERLKVQRRQLERKFSSAVGLSPKQLSKIIRLQAALKQLHQNTALSLTELAYQNGYFDQSHFIKDFKNFTGMSPKKFYADHLKLSILFIGSK